jgi:hypothetical protein
MIRKINTLEVLIADLDTEQFYGEEELWKSINRLIKVLEKKLQEANKRR